MPHEDRFRAPFHKRDSHSLWDPGRYTPFARGPIAASFGIGLRHLSAINPKSQLFADFEKRDSLRRDGNKYPAFWISPLPRPSMLHDETTKTADLDPISLRERIDH